MNPKEPVEKNLRTVVERQTCQTASGTLQNSEETLNNSNNPKRGFLFTNLEESHRNSEKPLQTQRNAH